jgi:hypothetical protein
MSIIKSIAIILTIYLGLVVTLECLVVLMGKRQAARGVQPGEDWLTITTTNAEGSRDTVVGGVESGGHLYAAANHWPRSWYKRAIENPEIEITRAGKTSAYLAVPVMGEERIRITRDYPLPWIVRLLTGFPPRSFLRLDPRSP